MRDKMKKTLGILLATACIGATFVGCGGGTFDYKGDRLDGYTSAAEVSSNGGFVVEKGDFVYFINGKAASDVDNTYGNVVKGALMRISKNDLKNGNYSNVKTVVPSLFVAKDYDAGIFIYGDYVYYATPTTEKTDRGEVASSYLDFKRAKLDGTEGPSKDCFLRLSDNASVYRFVEENGVVYCLYKEGSSLKSVNTETKQISTLVSGAKSAFFFDSVDPTNPYVYYTMNVTSDDGTKQSYDQVYRVNAGATAVTDANNAKYTVYNAKGEKITEYAFDKAEMEAKNEEQDHDGHDHDDVYNFEDYSTYPYVNLGELVLDGVGNGNYIPQTQYNQADKTAAAEYDGYTYTLGEDCYQDGVLYFTRSRVQKTTSDGTDTTLYCLADETVEVDGWNSIVDNVKATENIVALSTTNAASGAALYYKDYKDGKKQQYYIYVSDNNLYKAGYDNKNKAPIAAVRIANGVGSPTLWKIDGDYVYFCAATANGQNLSRVKYTGTAEQYNALNDNEEYQVASLNYLTFANDWYKPEIVGDTVLFANAALIGESSFNYVYAAKMGTVKEIKDANEAYKAVEEKIGKYSNYSDLQEAMRYFFRTGEKGIFNEFRDQYSESKGEKFDEFATLFADGGEFAGKLEKNFFTQVGKTSKEDEDAIAEAWRTVVRKYEDVEEEQDGGMATWLKWMLIGVGIGVVAAGAVTAVIIVKKKKAKKAEAEATVNAYKRKKIDTTDDKSIDVYADEDATETVEETTETVEEPVEETAEEAVEETVEEAAEETEAKEE